ncbi:hypothetical protein CEXT_445161 [Caerostris extrusa]|uniref:Uncharacterized protein n=1 Tax=Caerostris extrusa TaxID=172846 RepID=A0AAV4Y6Y5_CAEEX|nr:hypothetical protein CEXT_445161 [Caerostris extrusa]
MTENFLLKIPTSKPSRDYNRNSTYAKKRPRSIFNQDFHSFPTAKRLHFDHCGGTGPNQKLMRVRFGDLPTLPENAKRPMT